MKWKASNRIGRHESSIVSEDRRQKMKSVSR